MKTITKLTTLFLAFAMSTGFMAQSYVLDFEGSTDNYVSIPDSSSLDITDSITIETVYSAHMEISPGNYANNLRQIRQLISPAVKLCLVMKSDAYGHGIKLLAATAVSSEPAYIAAISNYEFSILHREIRKQKKDIRLFRIAPVLPAELVESLTRGYQVEEIIGSLEEAEMISQTAEMLSRKLERNITVNVHINIETGIGRMAFRDINDIQKVIQLPHLRIQGVMTHFANAYEPDPEGSVKTLQQTEQFDEMVAKLSLAPSVIRHVANSPATVRFPWTRKDMIRVGTLTYGEDMEGIDGNLSLRPVMISFKSRVAIIERNIPPMSPIGYNSLQKTRTNSLSKTATVRVGYSDLFPEMAFERNMHVLIRGKKFPVIGKTSMNMVVIDITDENPENQIHLDDEVVIIGNQGENNITLEEFFKNCQVDITQGVIRLGNSVDRIVVPDKADKN